MAPTRRDALAALLRAAAAAPLAVAGERFLRAAEGPEAPRPAPKTGFLYGDVYLRHKTGPGHPERPERLTAIVERLRKTGLMETLVPLAPAPAAMEYLTAIHSPAYVERVAKACGEGAASIDSLDVAVSQESYAVAVQAAGGVLAAVDAVMAGRVRNAFGAVRPPGHHALRDKAMGFCIFNNVAVAARYVQKKHGLAKVLIADWDVHHGNGTQAAFYADPTVFYFSTHRYPYYPGTGAADETGTGAGLGTTLNVPLPAGAGDAELTRAFVEKLEPAARAFKPDFVLVSAGFDAHADDPLGGLKVTAEGFGGLTRIVRRIADAHCRGRLVSVLEGGYDLAALAASVESHLRALLEP